jgi:hypothetical protein
MLIPRKTLSVRGPKACENDVVAHLCQIGSYITQQATSGDDFIVSAEVPLHAIPEFEHWVHEYTPGPFLGTVDTDRRVTVGVPANDEDA